MCVSNHIHLRHGHLVYLARFAQGVERTIRHLKFSGENVADL